MRHRAHARGAALALAAAALLAAGAFAQEAPGADDSPAGPGTPRGAVAAFLDAAGAGDGERAARFLELPRGRARSGPELALELYEALRRTLRLDLAALSAAPEGRLDDGLAPDRELLGEVTLEGETVPIVLERGRTADGAEVWRFERDTVALVPELYEAFVADPFAQRLPAVLVELSPLGVPLWKWIAALALVPLAALVGWLVTTALRLALGVAARRNEARDGARAADRSTRRIAGALRLAVAVGVIRAGLGLLRLPLAAQDVFDRVAIFALVVAFAWAAFRLLDGAAARIATRLRERGAGHAVPLVLPARKTAKVLVVLVALVVLLDNLGLDVTAVLAGLGVGGLAVALAAQRPLENLFSGITLYADQPVRVGDFCRFGTRVGTIEEIGLRSTRIRTLDRTIVTVPNREFASAEVENFGARDKIWYHPILGLRYETTPDQMRYVLVAVHRMLVSHAAVEPDTARIRFIGFGAYSLDLEVFAYVRTSDFGEFLAVAEDLNLRIMDIVEEAGTGFAFPSTTTYLERGPGVPAERAREVSEEVARLRERNELPLPRLPSEEVEALRGRIPWPGADGGARGR